MLMGEHAVLYGCTALAAAIEQRITVSIFCRDDDKIIIKSKQLGFFETTLAELKPEKPFDFVLTAIQLSKINSGVEVNIHADFCHNQGLGSSAAVTVATVAALAAAQHEGLDQYAVFTRALAVIHAVQKRGSGADVAASVYGGIVEYNCADIPAISKLIYAPDISVVFCGYKKPTTEVIALVREAYEKNPVRYENIFTAIDNLVQRAVSAIQTQHWIELGALFNEQQALMQTLGVSDDHLDSLIATLREQPRILGAKISGSGLGDCVIGVRSSEHNTIIIPDFVIPVNTGIQPTPISTQISLEGLRYE